MNGKTLKILALLAMIIDHIGGSVLVYYILGMGHSECLTLYKVMRGVGRFAFPVYCFLLVEGFVHTKNIVRYIVSTAIFALVSEIPFDMALAKGELFSQGHQNVYFTLFLALCCMCVVRWIIQRFELFSAVGIVLTVLAVGGFSLISLVFKTDYRGIGVLMIALMYLIRHTLVSYVNVNVIYFIMIFICAFALMVRYGNEVYAFAAVPFVTLYNGRRGKIKNKYLFYLAYPLHLLVLGLICRRLYGFI